MTLALVALEKNTRNAMENKEDIKKRLQKYGYLVIYEYDDPPNEEFPDHIHEGEELAVIISGSLEVKMDGVDYFLKAGDEIVFPAKMIHSAKVGPNGCVYVVGEKI